MNIRISIDSDSAEIPTVGKMVRHLCKIAADDDHPRVNLVELAVVELLNNIVNYKSSAGAIEVHCRLVDDDFSVAVYSVGPALAAEVVREYSNDVVCMPSLDTGIDSLPESGWGIQLIKSACDQVKYKRVGDKNVYQLVFDLSSATV